MLDIVASLSEDLYTIRLNIKASLDAVRRAAHTREKHDIFLAYKQLSQFEEIPTLVSNVVKKHPDAQRGRKTREAASCGGMQRKALTRERNRKIYQHYLKLVLVHGLPTKVAIHQITDQPKLFVRDDEQWLRFEGVRTVIKKQARLAKTES